MEVKHKSEQLGIEDLRACVKWCDWHNETFLQSFTIEGLIRLWQCSQQHPDWEEFADMWTEEQIAEAMQ